MQVGVAVLAFIGRVGKFQIGVAVEASYLRMSAPQREASFGMVEFDFS